MTPAAVTALAVCKGGGDGYRGGVNGSRVMISDALAAEAAAAMEVSK